MEATKLARSARKINPEATHHIMCRSISEINLFRDDEDKREYLIRMAKYKRKYQCSILAYCLMSTHVHIHFDPQGCDMSKFMQSLNLSYVLYYNRKYNRHGHLYQDRYKNVVIEDDRYNLAVSAYIHNNPKDISGYKDHVQDYPFSSYGIYTGQVKDEYHLIEPRYILSKFHQTPEAARKLYIEFVSNLGHAEIDQKLLERVDSFIHKEPYEYHSERYVYKRDIEPEAIIQAVAEKFDIPEQDLIKVKYDRSLSHIKAISVFLIRCLCNFSYKDISKVIGNLTLSQIAKLNNKGFKMMNHPHCKDLLSAFLKKRRVCTNSTSNNPIT
ncbi:MAG TPA: transposase [Clostridiales bacterium]|nr:transposase [Clostridiales bacterium]